MIWKLEGGNLTSFISLFKSLVVFFILLSLLLYCGCRPNEKFSADRWKEGTTRERYWMADDFLKTIQTEGMTLDDLKSLLGEPDYSHSHLVYYLNENVSPLTQGQSIYLNRPVLLISLTGDRVTYARTLAPTETRGKAFDARQWKTAPYSERLRMHNSMPVLQEMTVDEVIEVLGKADEKEVNYNLGLRNIDVVTLTFILNREGKTICAEKIEH
jgi:hypothetical protein